jgi:hypothetical protein
MLKTMNRTKRIVTGASGTVGYALHTDIRCVEHRQGTVGHQQRTKMHR